MKTPIVARDLSKEPPHSPRARFGGFAILGRAVDKCRASIAGTIGSYHYDCPLDNQLFRFKGINGEQFKKAVAKADNYEDVADWVAANGTKKTPEEIEAWSEEMEKMRVLDIPDMKSPEGRASFLESCRKLGLEAEKTTVFEWLEADDAASFHPHLQSAGN